MEHNQMIQEGRTAMRIENKTELMERMKKVLESIEEDERYQKSCRVLKYYLSGYEKRELNELREWVSDDLHDVDGAYPMHPDVAALIVDIYRDRVDDEDADAMCNLGALYYTGRAGKQDYEKAVFYYDMADKAGNRMATENMGYIYYYGRTGEKDYEKAFQYFVKAALGGSTRSLYKVGDFYRNGYYVEKDPREAFRIYQECTERMEEYEDLEIAPDVYMRMGDCLYDGTGVEKDLIGALRFMGLAETLFYSRLKEGDFYQKANLEHVLKVEEEIRKKIQNEELPDLSWAHYNE